MKFNTEKIQNIFNIQDKVAIVTGASRGIGEAIAHGFASFGANVVLAARTEEKLFLNSIQINDTGGSALPVKTDVTNYNDHGFLFRINPEYRNLLFKKIIPIITS